MIIVLLQTKVRFAPHPLHQSVGEVVKLDPTNVLAGHSSCLFSSLLELFLHMTARLPVVAAMVTLHLRMINPDFDGFGLSNFEVACFFFCY